MSNASRRPSCPPVIGSTKLPVVRSQQRVVPTPEFAIRAYGSCQISTRFPVNTGMSTRLRLAS